MSDLILTESACTVDGRPFVVLKWGAEAGQVDPATARILGLRMIMAADCAEHDAAAFRALSPMIDPQAIAGLLVRMRVERGAMPETPGDGPRDGT